MKPLMEAEGWPIKNTSVDDLIDLVDALATLGFFSAGSPGTVVLPLLSTFSNAMAVHSTAPQRLIKSELFLSCGFQARHLQHTASKQFVQHIYLSRKHFSPSSSSSLCPYYIITTSNKQQLSCFPESKTLVREALSHSLCILLERPI